MFSERSQSARNRASTAVLFSAGAGFYFGVCRFARLFKELGQTTGAGKNRAARHLAGFAAADNRGLFTGATEARPTASDRALAWCGRLLTKFGDLVCIEHRQRHPDFGQ
jgi:hypothetical protein